MDEEEREEGRREGWMGRQMDDSKDTERQNKQELLTDGTKD